MPCSVAATQVHVLNRESTELGYQEIIRPGEMVLHWKRFHVSKRKIRVTVACFLTMVY